MHVPEAKDWDLDIDRYINPYVPRNLTYRLPKPVSRFLGHRDGARKEIGNILVAVWSFLGAFIGIIVIEAVFMTPAIQSHTPPLLIASFVFHTFAVARLVSNHSQGAAAILEYNTIESPLAQPRNTIIGHFLAALVGICITKLFMLNPNFESLRWLAAALACGLASAIMTVTKTVYPPAGATALLAAVDPQVQRLGWFLLPLVLLSTAVTLVMSLLVNNIQRQYPSYWWTAADLGKQDGSEDIEKSSSHNSPGKRPTHAKDSEGYEIKITHDHIVFPEHIYLALEERSMLEVLRNRLADGNLRPSEPAARA
ncbi:hypothetical protein MMC28_009288 [Mycoblastus sanguinarius]|nr:hypothetical protein [Mycoblastus sanguinarius]